MRGLARTVGLLGLAGLLSVGTAHAVLIDNFDFTAQSVSYQASPVIVDNSGPLNLATNLGLEAIGDSRTMQLTNTANIATNASGDVLAPAPGVLTFSNGALSRSTLTLTWDANAAGLGGMDLMAGGATDITLSILEIDQGNVDLTLFITETVAAGGSTATRLISGAGVGIQQFAYASFLNFANVDFTMVDKIQLQIDSLVNSSDLTLDIIEGRERLQVVPEPGTLFLMGTGLAGVGLATFLRRRRQQS